MNLEKMRIRGLLGLIILIGLIVGCNTENEKIDLDEGFNYFPLKVGSYRIYEVDSIIYDFEVVRQNKIFIREEIVDTFLDEEKRVNYRIERMTQNLGDLDWRIKDVLRELRTQERVERIENNLRFIKMVFPVEEMINWDGNSFIDKNQIIEVEGETLEIFKGWESEVESKLSKDTIGGIEYEDIVIISHADTENLIELRKYKEHYAKEVGLIYKELWILD